MKKVIKFLHRLSFVAVFFGAGVTTHAQEAQSSSSFVPVSSSFSTSALPEAPDPQQGKPANPNDGPVDNGKQSKRILGIMPNFRAASLDQKLPPLSPKGKFGLFVQDSFDYSSFIYVGLLAGVGQAENSYPEFHQGIAGYGRYYWHSLADTIDGNLMTEALIPIATHEDPRYYTMGHGGFFKRTGYSVSRLLITRTDSGGRSPNLSEVVGNGASAGISSFYYPSPERTWTKTGQRWITQIGLDGASNLLKEFWPDINHALFHGRD